MLLVERPERVEFDCLFFLHYYFTAINTFPCIKIEKMVEKGLKDHKTMTLRTFHLTTPLGYPTCPSLYKSFFLFVNEKIGS